MKKIFALFLALLLSLSFVTAFADSIDEEEEELADTKYEQILQQKGILTKTELFDIGVFNNSKPMYNSENITSQMAVVTEMSTGEKIYALRLVYSYDNGKYDKGSFGDILDYDELDGIIFALESFKTGFTNTETSYVEYEYITLSGFLLAAIYNKDYIIYLQFNSTDRTTSSQVVQISYDQLDALIEFFKEAKAGMEEKM